MRIRAEKRRDSELNHELIWASIGTLVLLGAVLLSVLPHYQYPCMFLKLTGKPCLSCGMTRSFTYAVRGHFLIAWRWNPLGLVLMLGTLLYVPYAWTVALFKLPPIRVRLTRRFERIALLALLLVALPANWIYIWNNSMAY